MIMMKMIKILIKILKKSQDLNLLLHHYHQILTSLNRNLREILKNDTRYKKSKIMMIMIH